MHLKLLFVLTIIPGIFGIGYSQSSNWENLDTFIDILDEKEKFMGQLLVCENGKKVYVRTFGYSVLETGMKSDENTPYRIGSISKTITATLVLKAVEEGRLELSRTVEGFFPSIKGADKITVAHLLNHHSGIHNFTGDPDFMQWHTKKKSEEEMLAIIAQGGSDFEPGSKAEYSNSNYVLLSYILQSIYGEQYAAILKKNIVQPLGLENTFFGDRLFSKEHRTYSYTYEVGWNRVGETDLSIPMGAGGILMSAYDLSGFIRGLFKNQLISRESLGLMLEQKDGYGMGVFKTSVLGKQAYTHNGKIDGFNSVFYYFPEEQLTYVMLSNGENYNLSIINELVLGQSMGRPIDIPALTTYKVSYEDLYPYLGVYKSQTSPLVITVSRKGNLLLAQPKGQQVYTMEPIEKDMFKHDRSGVTLEFTPEKSIMLMKQGEQHLMFLKQ